MKTDVPHPIYLKDYAPPPFLVDETVLDFALSPAETRVRSRLSMRPNPASKGKPGVLKLDGEMLKLIRVTLDGKEVEASRYKITDKDLIIEGVPAEALHAGNRDGLQPRSQQGAVGALPQPRRLLHAMRGGRLPAHHLLSR